MRTEFSNTTTSARGNGAAGHVYHEGVPAALSVRVEVIDPESALAILERSEAAGFTNRKIRKTRVARYAHDMANGKWGFTGEPIIIGRGGELFNGNHRMHGVIDSSAVLPMIVIRGVDRSAYDSIDSGLSRGAGDVLGASGYESRNELASVARWLWRHDNGGILNSAPINTFSNVVAVEVVQRNPGLIASVKRAQQKGLRAIAPVSPMAFCHYVLTRIDRGAVDKFFDDLEFGEGLTSKDPVWHLRQRLIAQKSSFAKVRPEHLVILVFKAWNATRSGTAVGKLVIGSGRTGHNVPRLI